MSRKLRILRIVLVVLLVLFFAGYSAFVTFLFNPLEGSFALDVSALVPRDVDFFVARSDLSKAFGKFPHLRAEAELERHPAWKTFRASPEFADLDARMGIVQSLDEIETNLTQLPAGIDVLKVFGGEDLAVAGYFRPGGLETTDWTVYARTNWIGKLGESLLRFPRLLGLGAQGLQVEEKEGLVHVQGGNLPRPLFIGRVRDVFLAGTSEELLRQAQALAIEGGTESFFNSARYHDHVRNANRSAQRDELEFFVDLRKLLEATGSTGPLPDPKSVDFGIALLARLFQVPACKEAIGVLGLHGGIALDAHAELSSEQMSHFQDRLYRAKGADRSEILTAAAFAPEDTCFFLYATVPMGDLLEQMLEATEPATRSNLDELFRGSGRYTGVDEVIHMLDASMSNKFALILRENDYRPETSLNKQTGEREYVGPPNDGRPVFAFTVLEWMQDLPKIEQFRDTLKGMSTQLGLEGRTPGSAGVFTSTPGGFHLLEYWSRFVPGTGVIAHLVDNPISLVSNAILMPTHVMRTRDTGAPNDPRLSERPEFVALLDDVLKSSLASIVLWCDPPRAAATLRKQADVWARDQAASTIDWVAVREREETRLLREIAPGKSRDALSPEEQERLAAEIDAVLRTVREKEQDSRFPEIRKEVERRIVYFESIAAFLCVVRLDERRIDLGLRAAVHVPEPLPKEE